jgi:hypothetical protein
MLHTNITDFLLVSLFVSYGKKRRSHIIYIQELPFKIIGYIITGITESLLQIRIVQFTTFLHRHT